MLNVVYSLNRAFLGWSRMKFHWFLFTVVFPALNGNSSYPGAGVIVISIKGQWDQFYVAMGAGKTLLADEIYNQILNRVVDLMNYCVTTAANNAVVLVTSGFKLNKTTKDPEPQTAVPTNLMKMIMGGGKFMIKYFTDKNCHGTIGRTRLKGGADTDWRIFETSQNDTMYFEGYDHGKEYEVQVAANGTAGRSDWSTSIYALVD